MYYRKELNKRLCKHKSHHYRYKINPKKKIQCMRAQHKMLEMQNKVDNSSKVMTSY